MTASRPSHSTTPPTAQQLHPGIDLNPSTGASVLQAHLESCFLRGQLSDVKVRIDRFGREYRLHKVVLAQAAFFSSLFQGGWAEEEGGANGTRQAQQPTAGAGPSLVVVEPSMGVTSSDGGSEINLQMDDPNISRAAFEILLSRLYSTGPPLFVSPTTHPTPLHPLSPAFSQAVTSISNSTPPPLCPEEAQPATPRFLLSLLATSLFLGLPGVTQGVLGLVLGSMSPWSVGVYLGFAIGQGVGEWAREEWEIAGEEGEVEERGGRGLEELGVRVEESVSDEEEEEVMGEEKEGGKSGGGRAPSVPASNEGVKTESPSTTELPPSSSSTVHPTDRSPAPSRSNSTSTPTKLVPSRTSLRTSSSASSLASSQISGLREDDASSTFSREQPLFFYGHTSNKIGEACACWLTRWGVDILAVEEKLYLAAKKNEKTGGLAGRGRKISADAADAARSKGKGKSTTSNSSASPSSYFPFIPESSSSSSSSRPRHHPHPFHSNPTSSSTDFPPIFSLGGLPAPWLRAVISSDAFFVKNEMERYRVAKRVYDLRRAQREAVKKENGLVGGEERRGSFETESEMEEGEKEEEEEEGEFEELFAKGIYYSHMTFEELAIISHDINPSTSLPYAPLAILQTSNWSQQELKTRILSSGSPVSSTNLSSSSFSSSTDLASTASADLGISSSTTGIVHELGKVLEREARRRRRSRSVSSPYNTIGSPSSSRPFGSASSFSPYGGTPSSPPSSAPLSPLGAVGTPPTSTFSSLSLLPPISSSPSIADTKLYWPIPGDDTHRIGDYGGFLPLPSSGLATTGTTPHGSGGGVGVGGGKKSSGAAGERDFFGVGKGWRSGREILEGELGVGTGGIEGTAAGGGGGEQMWTKYEPFRFSVEFWGVDKLKEKQREYSNTVFYAGSYFNVYAQTIKKKDRQIQLGIYLHRQSMLEPTPVASAPPAASASTITNNPLTASQSPASPPGSTSVLSTSAPTNSSHLNHIPIHRSLSGTSTPVPYSPSISPPSATSSGISMGSGTSTPATVLSASFRDPRKVIKCYFSISCPSALGTAITRFSSAPDVFSVSQSWGWKSQSLRSEEYLSVLPTLSEMKESIEDGVMGWTGTIDEATFGKLQSLRATVVVGLV